MLQFKFEAEGYKVVTARDGVEGLEKLKNIQPNLIILDMNMPRMGGLEFYKNICVSGVKPQYPVLVLTARANLESLFKDFAIDGFMIKPFDIDQLAKQVDAIIKKGIQSEKAERPRFKSGALRRVFLAENDPGVYNNLALAFLNAGYAVNSAHSGAEAIERISEDVPNIALIKLGLQDIGGDLVITRLRHMAKTANVEYILYAQAGDVSAQPVLQKIGEKSRTFIEYARPEELLEAVDKLRF
jgi:DNA-binding response OmpR family regulator